MLTFDRIDMLALLFAWVWITAGLLAGVVLGLGFHRDGWMGGYGSWRRRLIRLGHISFFGTALLCIAFAVTAPRFEVPSPALSGSGALLMAGAVAMPTTCFLSAWRKSLRHLFVLPVACLLGGAGVLTAALVAGGLAGAFS
jgi:hypothetical protein